MCDQCIRYPGCLHGSCQQPWQCYCNEGWGGLFCNQDLNYCTNHKPCKNGGTCFNTGQGSYTCDCPAEFTGTDCELVKDDCTVIPCLNGGRCATSSSVDADGVRLNATCQCEPGFHGRRCETSTQQTCQDAPCLHGATCLDTADQGYLCLCPPGFDGANCGHQVDDCAVNRCLNGGSCVDKVNGFKCICPAGFSGDMCQTDINDCSDNPCLNSGTCVDLVNSFKCVCVPGFVGSLCQSNVDDCLTKPCSNGGQCQDLVNDYKCLCRPGFTGKDCSVETDECASNPCLNGGTCLDRVNEFRCQCPRPFAGQRCERLANASTSTVGAQSRSRAAPMVTGRPSDDHLSAGQIVLIATISTAVPLVAIVSCLAIVLMKRRRKKEQVRADEEARRQNEQNVVHSISKKMDKMDKHLEEHRIINALDFPAPLPHKGAGSGKCLNGSDYVKESHYHVVQHQQQQPQQPPSQPLSRTKALNVDVATQRQSTLFIGVDHKLNSPPLPPPPAACEPPSKDGSCHEPTYVTLDKRLDDSTHSLAPR